jgi:geranylgeranyl pyrophosphate synthase
MKLVSGDAAERQTWSSRDVPLRPRAPDGAVPAMEATQLEAVWPRRFDLDAIRSLLGHEADQVLCDLLASRVTAPIWSLADRGGKRWRPAISRLAFLVTGGTPPVPDSICQVAELLHTGSLIVDDIQDGATERRGGPAAHVAFGIPTALNAANTAYFRALEILRRALPNELRLRALDMLAEELLAAHLGQALDLALAPQLRRTALRTSHYFVLARAKTGALMRIAARLGAIAADAEAAHEAALCEWASELGVAYQIQNDLDDLACGMHDVSSCRPTYPLLLILEQGGPAAATLSARLGGPPLASVAAHELRDLFARERVAERGRDEARRSAERALEAIRTLPAGESRDALEGMTRELSGHAIRP